MDSKRAAMVMLLLLLLSGWGHSEGPRDWDGDELLVVSRPWPHVTILPSLGRAFCPSFRHTLATWGGLCCVLTDKKTGPRLPVSRLDAIPSPVTGALGGCAAHSLPTPYPSAQEEDSGARPVQDAQSTRSLLRSLLGAMERQGRSPAFQFQPQRFGRNAGGPWNNQRLRPRGGQGPGSQFWSLATPQRFGKK
ncbi:LOW QUALITY PROTEIN: pro-FMRFamide-related neuropeptide FF [Ochotona curzoniae]|uniref:LOW QUALITY PROTEIN: pro-FMRFamide-related neuropeptide FF n=1 Tax=Ochotona curzoniae TaxID=130825 RepID=UPI001B347E8D|nr:LOW QUALITY PROTEIN: pro-FMRFamide-related neuropeptide FF [Ochotona curzoniae]